MCPFISLTLLVATVVMTGFRVRVGTTDAVPSELGYRVNMKHESRRGVPAHPGPSKAADSPWILPQAASRVPPSVVSLSHSEEINICLRASCLWMMSCFCLSPFL